jgi:hypothetical protein
MILAEKRNKTKKLLNYYENIKQIFVILIYNFFQRNCGLYLQGVFNNYKKFHNYEILMVLHGCGMA